MKWTKTTGRHEGLIKVKIFRRLGRREIFKSRDSLKGQEKNVGTPYRKALESRVRIFKRLWSPGIDSKESIPPAYEARRAGTNNPIPTRFLAPIDCLKIPELVFVVVLRGEKSIPGID